MAHIKKFNESLEDSNNNVDLEPLTIEEFSNLREAMYAVKNSSSPSTFQAKGFFKDENNFDVVVEKLRKLLSYKK